jgi:hypothetical protein
MSVGIIVFVLGLITLIGCCMVRSAREKRRRDAKSAARLRKLSSRHETDATATTNTSGGSQDSMLSADSERGDRKRRTHSGKARVKRSSSRNKRRSSSRVKRDDNSHAVQQYMADRGPSPTGSNMEPPVPVYDALQRAAIAQQIYASQPGPGMVAGPPYIATQPYYPQSVPMVSPAIVPQQYYHDDQPQQQQPTYPEDDAVTLNPTAMQDYVQHAGTTTIIEMEDVLLTEVERRTRETEKVR